MDCPFIKKKIRPVWRSGRMLLNKTKLDALRNHRLDRRGRLRLSGQKIDDDQYKIKSDQSRHKDEGDFDF